MGSGRGTWGGVPKKQLQLNRAKDTFVWTSAIGREVRKKNDLLQAHYPGSGEEYGLIEEDRKQSVEITEVDVTSEKMVGVPQQNQPPHMTADRQAFGSTNQKHIPVGEGSKNGCEYQWPTEGSVPYGLGKKETDRTSRAKGYFANDS